VSTIFSLRTNGDEIARCLLTWNNADCAELGPNIEMLAVHQSRRGQGWLHTFYSMIEHFVLARWTMTGLTEDGKKRCRIFASYLTGTEVETRRRSNGESESVCDKDFFLRYQGFDVRFDAMNCIGGCPADEDAVKYIKPNASTSLDAQQLLFVGPDTEQMPKYSGRSVCHYCACSSQDAHLSLCSGCKQVRYCSSVCQAEDWPQHKLWCRKSKEDFEADMVAMGVPYATEDSCS